MQEAMEMHGRLTLELRDRSGAVVHRSIRRNRIVTSGRRLVAEFFSGTSAGTPPAAVTHMAVGASETAPSDGDTALGAQRGSREPISDVQVREVVEGGITRVQVSLEAVFDYAEANDPATPLREAGIFNAASGGIMYNRVVFEPVTKTDAFRLTLFWDVVF
jgi:hypothetical protein